MVTVTRLSVMPRVAKLAFLPALALSVVGCEPTATTATFAVNIRAESDPGKAVAEVEIKHGGKVLGRTDQQGLLRLSLQGRPGEAYQLDVKCPDGHASPHKPIAVVLRPLASAQVPTYQAECRPLVRSLVVAVKAENGPNIPLMYQGREIARTDTEGAAHALLRVPPEQHVTLVLDTSSPEHVALRPHSPELNLTMPGRDEMVVFEHKFAVKSAPRKKVRRKPTKRLPQPIR